jgi:hypothetical protein
VLEWNGNETSALRRYVKNLLVLVLNDDVRHHDGLTSRRHPLDNAASPQSHRPNLPATHLYTYMIYGLGSSIA